MSASPQTRRRAWRAGVLGLIAAALGYLAFWPTPIDPLAWDPPENPGYTGAYAANDRLTAAEIIPLDGARGPEDLAVGPDGALYMAVEADPTGGGRILRLAPGELVPQALTIRPEGALGRPLGLAFGRDGALYVADAYRGLLRLEIGSVAPSVSPPAETTAQATVLADAVDGAPLGYANDVEVAPDGVVYVTRSTTRFPAEAHGGTLAASILDLAEHRLTGQLLAFDPRSGGLRVVAEGFSFANGLALSEAGDVALLVETGAYRVWRVTLTGPEAGARRIVLDGLPGFPDNIERAGDRFWLGLVSPRRAVLDALAGWPRLRKVVMRLPTALRPGPTAYGFILAIDAEGRVLQTLQDPSGRFALSTGAVALGGRLYVSNLASSFLAHLPDAPSPQ